MEFSTFYKVILCPILGAHKVISKQFLNFPSRSYFLFQLNTEERLQLTVI